MVHTYAWAYYNSFVFLFYEGLAEEQESKEQGTDDETSKELEPTTAADGIIIVLRFFSLIIIVCISKQIVVLSKCSHTLLQCLFNRNKAKLFNFNFILHKPTGI